MIQVSEAGAERAYDLLAPSYDTFTQDHDQAAWTALLLELAEASGLQGRRLLDVGCGTGGATLPMIERGFDARGVDVSEGMLAIAQRKLGARANVSRADMRALPSIGSFDLVWALSDVVNYLLGEDELVAAFAGFRRNLASDGVVVFDVNSLATMRALYTSILVRQSADEVVVFEGLANEGFASGDEGHALVDRLTSGDRPPFWSRSRGHHRQRHHEPRVVVRALERAGLRCCSLTGIDRDGRPHDRFDDLAHSKAVYVARATAPEQEGR